MKLSSYRSASLVLLAVLTIGAGCSNDNIALVGRNTLSDRASQPLQDEIEATVTRVDAGSREITLRKSDGGTRVVGYSTEARVMYGGREYPVSELEVGDVVVMQFKQDSRGAAYSDLIRVQRSTIRDRDSNRGSAARSEAGMRTLDGRVERVDLKHNSFEIREQAKDLVTVSVPGDARRTDIERFRALRSGDYVKVEGWSLDRGRFELNGFLRDNY